MAESPSLPNHDRVLVQVALTDVNAFGKLIELYEKKLLRYIQRISQVSHEDAEEILQEVFLKAWRNLRDFDQSLPFSSWIYRITHNETISHYRKLSSRGELKKVAIEDLYDLSSDELSIPEQVDRTERAKQVKRTLQKLSEIHREILILRYFENKSYEEISDILQKPMGTIASLVNRAKQAFKSNISLQTI